MELFPEERENFLQQLYKFMEDRGEPRMHTRLMFTGFFYSPFLFSRFSVHVFMTFITNPFVQ